MTEDIQNSHNVENVETERIFKEMPSSNIKAKTLTEEAETIDVVKTKRSKASKNGANVTGTAGKLWEELPIIKTGTTNQFVVTRRALFILDKLEEAVLRLVKEQGNEILTKRNVSEYLPAIIIALYKRLYKDSYAVGKWKQNTGRYQLNSEGRARVDMTRAELLKAITRGHPTQSQVRIIDELLRILYSNPLWILDENGNGQIMHLITINGEVEQYIIKHYSFSLDPIFYDLAKGYGKITDERLDKLIEKAGKKKTGADYKLLWLFGVQEQDKPSFWGSRNLAKFMGMEDEFKKNRGRVEDKQKAKLEVQVDIGSIEKYDFDGDIITTYPPNYSKIKSTKLGGKQKTSLKPAPAKDKRAK